MYDFWTGDYVHSRLWPISYHTKLLSWQPDVSEALVPVVWIKSVLVDVDERGENFKD